MFFKFACFEFLLHIGYVILSGRIKEIIITSGGENIGPVQIEDVIKEEIPCLSNAMVCNIPK